MEKVTAPSLKQTFEIDLKEEEPKKRSGTFSEAEEGSEIREPSIIISNERRGKLRSEECGGSSNRIGRRENF